MRSLLPLVLFAASVCFALGVTLPILEVERLFFLIDEPSLAAIVHGLWSGGDPALALLILMVSIVFPAVKLCLLHLTVFAQGPESPRALPGWLKAVANWSMLDVVLVALVIFAAKTTGFATAASRPGLWFFAASAVLTALASWLARSVRPPA